MRRAPVGTDDPARTDLEEIIVATTIDRPSPSLRSRAHADDWIEVHGLPGFSSRNGQIQEVIGAPGHERFRVRWDEQHESILYPSEAVQFHIRPAGGAS